MSRLEGLLVFWFLIMLVLGVALCDPRLEQLQQSLQEQELRNLGR